MEEINFEITIPPDDDGYVLLQCPNCGEFFKATAVEIQNDNVLEIFCPACGLAGDSYFTDDFVELADAIVKNYASDLVYNEIKKWEKKLNNNFITFNAGKKPNPEPENPLKAWIEALTITRFLCCSREAKVKPLLKITGCYCPFCGVKNYEVE